MKKIIISIFSIIILLFPSISMAQLSQSKIQKEMVIARYQVDKDYWVQLVQKIDKIFIDKIVSNDNALFESLNSKLSVYFNNKSITSYLTKKERLYKYLYIRTTYELKYRKIK